jgi:hypothetical protein
MAAGQARPVVRPGLRSHATPEHACKWTAAQTVSWIGRKVKTAACHDPKLGRHVGPWTRQRYAPAASWHVACYAPMLSGYWQHLPPSSQHTVTHAPGSERYAHSLVQPQAQVPEQNSQNCALAGHYKWFTLLVTSSLSLCICFAQLQSWWCHK